MSRIKLHKGQTQIFRALFVEMTKKFVTACCSRGFGKSYKAAVAATTAVFELMEMDEEIPNKTVYIIAPTLDQAKEIYFPLLVHEFHLDDYCIKPPSADTGKFDFGKGVTLRLVSFEAIERLRGKGKNTCPCKIP